MHGVAIGHIIGLASPSVISLLPSLLCLPSTIPRLLYLPSLLNLYLAIVSYACIVSVLITTYTKPIPIVSYAYLVSLPIYLVHAWLCNDNSLSVYSKVSLFI